MMVKERVPIAPIERACLPGGHLMMDVIGPIDPPSAQWHKYLLKIICMHTKWPFAYLLKNIGAKSICDCMCDVFSHLGIAHAISSDCGCNFVSKLTQEFLECMGCSPKFTSPV
jgi:Integrase core domain